VNQLSVNRFTKLAKWHLRLDKPPNFGGDPEGFFFFFHSAGYIARPFALCPTLHVNCWLEDPPIAAGWRIHQPGRVGLSGLSVCSRHPWFTQRVCAGHKRQRVESQTIWPITLGIGSSQSNFIHCFISPTIQVSLTVCSLTDCVP
jgi:hypothetical protein